MNESDDVRDARQQAADGLFESVRSALQDGAGAGDARYVYPAAWELLDRLDTALHMLRYGMDELRPDATLTTDAERWARHGQRTVLESVEEAAARG